jgi:hypothetical protein
MISFDHIVPFARNIGRVSVGQVPARREIEAHKGVARLQQREEHRLVRLRAGMRLHIGERAIEQPAGAFDRQRLGDVDIFAAAVVAPARITFGIFVGQDGALRLQDRPRHNILGRDQLDLFLLAGQLMADGRENLRVTLGQSPSEKIRARDLVLFARRCHSTSPTPPGLPLWARGSALPNLAGMHDESVKNLVHFTALPPTLEATRPKVRPQLPQDENPVTKHWLCYRGARVFVRRPVPPSMTNLVCRSSARAARLLAGPLPLLWADQPFLSLDLPELWGL